MSDDQTKKFVDAVRQMRTAQRKYFRTRDSKVLSEAKEWEKIVDRHLKDLAQSRPLFD